LYRAEVDRRDGKLPLRNPDLRSQQALDLHESDRHHAAKLSTQVMATTANCPPGGDMRTFAGIGVGIGLASQQSPVSTIEGRTWRARPSEF